MAGRILNRRELRKQADEAEARESQQGPEADDDEELDDAEEAKDRPDGEEEEAGLDAEDEEARPPKKKAKAPPKPRKPRKPKAAPRMRARWGVFDASMKQMAIFDYNQRAAADAKVTELAAKKNGTFFIQMIKEPMPEPVPENGSKTNA